MTVRYNCFKWLETKKKCKTNNWNMIPLTLILFPHQPSHRVEKSGYPGISWRNSEKFSRVATIVSVFGKKSINYCLYKTHSNSKWIPNIKNQPYVYFYTSYYWKNHQISNLDIFKLKIWIPDKQCFFVTWPFQVLHDDAY